MVYTVDDDMLFSYVNDGKFTQSISKQLLRRIQ